MSGLFATAQPRVATNMISASAERQNYGMVQREKGEETNGGRASAAKDLPFVSTGNTPGVVSQLPISKTTDAQTARKRFMVLNSVLAEKN